MTEQERKKRMEKLFEKMLNMEMTNREIYEQCRNVAHKPMTNEEYLRSCNTEQLADWLKDTLARCYRCGGCDELAERNCTVKICYYADVAEWLKQPHKE